jgi:hypothetical protein
MDAPVVYVEYAPLSSYLVVFKLKGKTTEETVKANSSSQARQIIKDRYDGKNIQIISVRKV